MHNRFAFVTLVALAILTFSETALADDAVEFGRARLQAINDSGIRAQIVFVDTGTELHVVGAATSMDPDAVYRSLIYDNGSQPRGAQACLPGLNPEIPPLGPQRMFIGFWEPVGSSVRVLRAALSGDSFVPLGEFATMSVRQQLGGPPPGDNSDLRACGRVRD